MRTRLAVVVMAALLAIYLVFAVRYGFLLVGLGEPVAVAIGAALFILPVIAAGVLAAEILTTVRAGRLGRILATEGGLPDEELPTLPSGRVDPRAADAVFPRYRAEAEAAPDDWRAWYRLALAYDAAGDRRRARWAVREAVRLSRAGA